MTATQRVNLKKEMKAAGYGWINGIWVQPEGHWAIIDEELSCISMIDSILAYDAKGIADAEAVMEYEESEPYNYLAKYVELLGRNRVVELIQGQIDSIAKIDTNVFTDSEGLNYNNIVWQ